MRSRCCHGWLSGMLPVLVLACLAAGPAFAQVSLSTPEKINYIEGSIRRANETMAKGETDKARYWLLAATGLVGEVAEESMPFDNRRRAVNAFMAACDKAWPGAGPKQDEARMQAWTRQVAQDKQRLLELAGEFNLSPPPEDRWEYWKRVTTVMVLEKEAIGLGYKLCADAPSPDYFLTNKDLLRQFSPVFRAMFDITYGSALARWHARTRVARDVAYEALIKMIRAGETNDVMVIGENLEIAREAIDTLAMIDAQNPDLPELREKMKNSLERLKKLYGEQVPQNRMPGDNYKGADKQALVNEASELYKKRFSDEEIVLVKVPSQAWAEAWEGWWEDDAWRTAYAGYVDVAFAAKGKDGLERVYLERFRRTRNADGWSPMRHWRNIACYRILPENIN